MIVDRVYTPGLAQVAYLIAGEDERVAAVIDPRRDVDAYIEWAARHGLRITAILETHVHADFVSGARELAGATGAPVFASLLGNSRFPHHALSDGDQIKVGGLILQAFWTPGHTPEHMSYLLIDPSQGGEPVALFSGDLLFVGEVGRPDLLGTEHTRTLAEQLYESIAHRLSPLSDRVVVYPGHTAGSSCGKKIGDAPQTTMGQERLFNYALRPEALASKETFIDTILAGMPVPPAYYPTMKRVNQVGPALLRDLPEGNPLSPEDVERRVAGGALIVDARSPDAFASGHISGSFFIGDDADRVNWIGWLAPYDRDLVFLLADDSQFDQVRIDLLRIGLDRIAGYVAGGIERWTESGRWLSSMTRLTPAELVARLAHQNRPTVIDVRTNEEWRSGHIPGSINRFVGEIARGAQLPGKEEADIALICATGIRSTVAASLLEAKGRHGLVNVVGGMDAWQAAGLQTEAA